MTFLCGGIMTLSTVVVGLDHIPGFYGGCRLNEQNLTSVMELVMLIFVVGSVRTFFNNSIQA